MNEETRYQKVDSVLCYFICFILTQNAFRIAFTL